MLPPPKWAGRIQMLPLCCINGQTLPWVVLTWHATKLSVAHRHLAWRVSVEGLSLIQYRQPVICSENRLPVGNQLTGFRVYCLTTLGSHQRLWEVESYAELRLMRSPTAQGCDICKHWSVAVRPINNFNTLSHGYYNTTQYNTIQCVVR